MEKKQIDLETLKKIFVCEAEQGELRWRVSSPRAAAGQLAGVVNSEGYRVVGYGGSKYRVHRIIWAMYYEAWPEGDLDHVNGIKTDNRISNLRPCTHGQNMQNCSKRVHARKSRHKGVDFHKGRWRARIRPGDGGRMDLGYFATEEEAAAAYAAAAEKFHGEFSRL